jgi:hypothetical protein
LGIETNAKKVLPGVIGYFHDTRQSGDGGAHGVGAADSDKPALLYQARYPEIYMRAIHGESSVKPVCPAFRLHSARPAGLYSLPKVFSSPLTLPLSPRRGERG